MFAIANDTGDIYVVGSVDAEMTSGCLLTVVAVDRRRSGSLPAYARVVIHIRNVNDNPPRLSINTLSPSIGGVTRGDIADGAPIGAFVAYVGVSDADSASSAIQCTVNSTLFNLERLDAGDYQLTSAVVFERRHDPVYPVTITCRDGGDGQRPVLSSSESLEVIVVDSGPRFQTGQSPMVVHVVAGLDPPGTVLVRLNATNTDVGPEAEVVYSMATAASEPSNALLAIDSRTGTVATRIVFGPETVNRTYVFLVTAVDRGTPPLSANVTLTVVVTGGNWPAGDATTEPAAHSTNSSSQATSDAPQATVPITLVSAASYADVSSRDVIIIATVVSAGFVVIVSVVIVVAVICCCCRRRRTPKIRKATAETNGHMQVPICTSEYIMKLQVVYQSIFGKTLRSFCMQVKEIVCS